MKNDIYLIGEIGWEVNLATVKADVENSDSKKPLNVYIHSQGGSVYDGLAIYNYLKNLKQEVNTISSGLVASIASIIFMAGKRDTRKINRTDSFLIHLPMGMAGGNAEDLEKTAEELREIEDKLATIYSVETKLSFDEAMDLMKDDKMLDIDFLKEKEIVNEIVELKAVATLNINKNRDMEALTKKDAESLFEKFGKSLKAMFNPENNVENKTVQDSNGDTLNFRDVEVTNEVQIGDRAFIEDKPVEDGERTMPNGEVWSFAGGKLESIVEAPEESEEVTNLKAEVQTLTDENTTNTEKITELEGEIEAMKTAKTDMENEFTDLKEKITSSFEYDGKKKKKEEPTVENKTRSLFKKAE